MVSSSRKMLDLIMQIISMFVTDVTHIPYNSFAQMTWLIEIVLSNPPINSLLVEEGTLSWKLFTETGEKISANKKISLEAMDILK